MLIRAIHREHFLVTLFKKEIATAKELDLRLWVKWWFSVTDKHTHRHFIIIYISSTCRLASIDVADWSDQIYSFFTGDQTGINFITNIGLQVTNAFPITRRIWAICGKIRIIFAVCLQSSWLPQQSLGVAGCEQRVLFESQEIWSFALHVWLVLSAKYLPFDLTSNS